MKTYTETAGKVPFNWRTTLSADNINWYGLEDRARSWVTCACGNQCSIIPRSTSGCPEDEVLQNLGGDNGFYGAIKSRNAKNALAYLDLIELRSGQLIVEAIPNEGKRLRKKQVDTRVRHASEVTAMKNSHKVELAELKVEIDNFVKLYPNAL